MLAEKTSEVVRGDPIPDKSHSAIDPRNEYRIDWIEIHDRDQSWFDIEVLQQDGQCAPGDGAKADKQDTVGK